MLDSRNEAVLERPMLSTSGIEDRRLTVRGVEEEVEVDESASAATVTCSLVDFLPCGRWRRLSLSLLRSLSRVDPREFCRSRSRCSMISCLERVVSNIGFQRC